MIDKYFVMLPGLRGPRPQIWHELKIDGSGKVKPTLFLSKLEGNQLKMTLDELGQEFKNEISGIQNNY